MPLELEPQPQRVPRSLLDYQEFLELLPDGALIVDSFGNICTINSSAVELLRYPKNEIVGKSIEQLIPKPIQSIHKDFVKNFFISPTRRPHGKVINLACRRSDQTTFPCDISLSSIRVDEKNFALAIVYDLTTLTNSNNALEASEILSQTVLRSLSSEIVVLSSTGMIIAINDAYRAFAVANGANEATYNAVGTNYLEVVKKAALEDNPFAKQAMDGIKSVLDGSVAQFEITYPCSSPTQERWFHMLVTPTKGSPGGAVMSHTNITSTHLAEDSIRTSETRYRRLFETAKDGILILDAETGVVADVNPFMIDLLGYPKEYFLDKKVWELGFLKDLATSEIRFEELQLREYIRYEDLPLKTSAGVLVAVEFVSNVYKVNGRKVIQCNIRNVTERVRAQKALVQLNSDLEQRVEDRTHSLKKAKEEADRANLSKSEFLSRMSHELRTPLNSVLGFAQLLELQYQDPNIREATGAILKGGKHLLAMINEVLEISRIESGNLITSVENIPIAEILQETMILMKPLAQLAGLPLHLESNIKPDLQIRGDHQRLVQVLVNLLSNAIKYNRPGGSVLIHCTQVPTGICRINVIDSGFGIAKADQQFLFQPFKRFGNLGIEGTGLGLALSERFSKIMGGKLTLAASSAAGSNFQLEIPIMEEIAASKAIEAPMVFKPVVFESKPGTVLIVDDNAANLKLFEAALTSWKNLNVISAMQGLIGLELAKVHRPDLILLDLHLPDLSGEEVLRRIKSDDATNSIPVVIVSADSTENQIRRQLEAGASGYLTKPLDLKKLFDVLRTYFPVENPA